MSAVCVVEELETPMERLELEIREEAAHLDAATSRWLGKVAEFDRRQGWATWMLRSAAHWLNWQCGIALSTAREQVRVARRLEEFPLLAELFGCGRISYSKVRAITRVATDANIDTLIDMALEATAAQLDRVVRSYKGVRDNLDKGRAKARHDRRFFNWHWDDDGSLVFSGRLDTDDGMVLLTALAVAGEALGDRPAPVFRPPTPSPSGAEPVPDAPADARPEDAPADACPEDAPADACPEDAPADACPEDAPADASFAAVVGGGLADVELIPTEPVVVLTDDPGTPPSAEHARADALALLAETMLACGPTPKPGGARTEVVLHLDLPSLLTDGIGHFQDGPSVGSDLVRQLLCDCGVIAMLEDELGHTIDVGRRTRVPNRALRRALQRRDHGCMFPGCTQEKYVDGHHVTFWGDEGPTKLDNMIQLCKRHHAAIHRHGWQIISPRRGEFRFHRPDGRLVHTVITPPAGDPDLPASFDRQLGLDIDDQTGQPNHPGPCDYGMAIQSLLAADGLADYLNAEEGCEHAARIDEQRHAEMSTTDPAILQ